MEDLTTNELSSDTFEDFIDMMNEELEKVGYNDQNN